MRLALLNPNASAAATRLMAEQAGQVLAQGWRVQAHTLGEGAALIADPLALTRAARLVQAMGETLAGQTDLAGVMVAAFGDPGVPSLRERLALPVMGLGEAGIREAARDGARFSIVTVTPALHDSLVRAAHAHAPPAQFAGVRYTQGAAADAQHSPEHLEQALWRACDEAIRLDGAESIVIGGGPLAAAAKPLAMRLPVPIVNPVWAAARWLCAQAETPPIC